MLKGKNILLGVTGSIAAYKAAMLCRLLRSNGADVKVIMSATAKEFITPLTMATLSKHPILVDFFNPENGEWNSHISLGEWADCYLIAPATANTIGKMACGIADNLLLTTYLSARCPVMIAPAMDCDMMAHDVVQTNIETLRQRNVTIIEPAEGELASGLIGKGRMAEPEDILQIVARKLSEKKKSKLCGKRCIVTAGATIEPIDPVRYITNHSTGKMGYAIAAALEARGAEVQLISGRTALDTPTGVERIDVVTAEDMYREATSRFEDAEVAVMCAAVADYTPKEVATSKIKKGEGDMQLTLRRTHDIAATLGAKKGNRVIVGFALESDDGIESAKRKLTTKSFDFVVLNSMSDKGATFGTDTNIVTFVDKRGCDRQPLLSKADVAELIADRIESVLTTKE